MKNLPKIETVSRKWLRLITIKNNTEWQPRGNGKRVKARSFLTVGVRSENQPVDEKTVEKREPGRNGRTTAKRFTKAQSVFRACSMSPKWMSGKWTATVQKTQNKRCERARREEGRGTRWIKEKNAEHPNIWLDKRQRAKSWWRVDGGGPGGMLIPALSRRGKVFEGVVWIFCRCFPLLASFNNWMIEIFSSQL